MASIGKESAPPISSSPKYPPPTSPPPTTPPPFSLSGASTPSQPMPPELPYSLRDHKKSIAAIWTLLVIDTAVVPLVLFYSLWDDTRLRPMWIMTITTSLYGLISGFEWAYRTYVLFTRERLRPLDASKWAVSGPTAATVVLSINAASSWTSSILPTQSATALAWYVDPSEEAPGP